MRVIITGGTGLIGRQLAANLANERHEIIVLSRHPETARGLPASVQVVGWDARTAQGWGQLVDAADAIVNLDGESIGGTGLIPARWTKGRKQRILQSRLDAAHAVVQAVEAAAHKPRVVGSHRRCHSCNPFPDEPRWGCRDLQPDRAEPAG